MASTSKNLKISSYGAGGSSSKHKANAIATPVSPDADAATTTVHIPFLRTNSKQLHTYTAALQRSADEHLAAEDLDNIQSELELLLSNVAIRYRVLKSEYESLDKDERRNERKHKHNEKQPTSPAPSTLVSTSHTKRKREDGTGSVRKAKHSSSASLKHNKHAKNSPITQNTDDSMDYLPGTSGGGVGISAAGFGMPAFHSHPHGQNRDHHLQKMAVPKNDTPNKFWLSVEPFCMPITNEDLRLLDDLLEQYNGPLVPPIPDLGPHYTSVWAAEDLKEIQQNSNPNAHANRLKPQNSNTSNAAGSMLKKAEAALEDSVTGPLTQRLVSALMEEQLLQNPTELAAECSNSSSENTHSSTPLNFRSLSMLRNCVGIEKRIKKELIEQGILESADFPNNDEDEIQAEIKRLTVELTSVAEYNGSALRRLRETAVEEMKRLEIKRKLDIIDQEILETYKRTMQSKSKRKALSAEEQQEIYRLTAEQKSLSEQLEQSQASFVPFE